MADYRVNDAGDVYAVVDGSSETAFEPERFGWAAPSGRTTPDERRTLDQVSSLPGFEVRVETGPRFVPGPRTTVAIGAVGRVERWCCAARRGRV